MKSKIIASMEDYTDNVDESHIQDDDLVETLVAQNQTSTEIDDAIDQSDEAEDTKLALIEIDNASSPEQALEIAKEHLFNKLGYKKNLSEKLFNSELVEDAIAYAQEGIFDSLGTAFALSVTSDAKLATQVRAASAAVPEDQDKDKKISNPSWGWIVSSSGSSEVSAQTAVAVIGKYNALISGSGFGSLISSVESLLNKVEAEKERNYFVANLSSNDEVDKLKDKVEKFKQSLESIADSKTKKSVNVQPLNASQATRLASEVVEILSGKNLDKISSVLKKEVKSGAGTYNVVSSFRYRKEKPEDVARAKKAINNFRSALQDIKNILNDKSRIALSALQYIKASSK